MVWYAVEYNQIEPARGNSGLRPICVPTLAGSFIGDSTMKRIPLTQGKFAIIDNEDFEWLNQWKWYAIKKNRIYYAGRKIGKRPYQRNFYMHTQIMKTPIGYETDHKNHNTLDNRKTNMRNCTHCQNLQNQKSNCGMSKFKGVSWHKPCNKWRAYIKHNNKFIHLGLFINEIDAAKAYDQKAKELFGKFAYLNFGKCCKSKEKK